MNRNLYALLVGIDEYREPVNPLAGCVNDINHIHGFMSQHLAINPKVEILTNSDATRQNIIRMFRTHLCKAGPEDVVLFYFSGHGSTETAAQGFKEFFPGGQNETLVCYDSRHENGQDLADKELAVLLSEVAKKQPHLVVALDCCHSGSGTREAITANSPRSRSVSAKDIARLLESYLDGCYAGDKTVIIPRSKHLLMAACARHQEAHETSTDNGLFSTSLLKVLTATNGRISYADLFRHCRLEIAKWGLNQTPQFETYNHFPAYATFMDLHPSESRQRFMVYFDDTTKYWKLEAGALHHIPREPEKQVEVALYPFPDKEKNIQMQPIAGYGRILELGAQKSRLELDFKGNKELNYHAELINLPVPQLPVYLEAEDKRKDQLTKKMALPGSGYEFCTDIDSANYILSADSNQILLFRKQNRLLLQGASGDMDSSMAYMDSIIEKVVRFEQVLDLQNNQSKLNLQAVDFHFVTQPGSTASTTYTGHEVTLEYAYLDGKWQDIKAKLTVRNRSPQTLYCMLLYLSRHLGIMKLSNEPIPPHSTETTLWGEAETDAFLLPEGVNDAIDRFLLVISTEPADDFLLTQDKVTLGKIKTFQGIRGKRDIPTPDTEQEEKIPISNDWFTKPLTVHVVRKIVENQD